MWHLGRLAGIMAHSDDNALLNNMGLLKDAHLRLYMPSFSL